MPIAGRAGYVHSAVHGHIIGRILSAVIQHNRSDGFRELGVRALPRQSSAIRSAAAC
jgi:hypothetical protein